MFLYALNIAFQIIDSGSFTNDPLSCKDYDTKHSKIWHSRVHKFCSSILKRNGVFAKNSLEDKFSSNNQDLNALYNMFWLNRIVFNDLLYYPCGKYQKACNEMDDKLEYGWWYPQQLIEYINHLLKTTNNFEWFGSEEEENQL